MHTGWLKDDGNYYYFTSRGIVVTGWQVINGAYYYFDSSGAMCTGWIKVNNKWYYMNTDGSMRVGWIKLDGNWYYLNTDGSMRTGWYKIDGETYYFNSSGVMLRGVQTINGYGYYFASDGHMVTKSLTDGKRTFRFYSDGRIKYIKMDVKRVEQGNTKLCWAASAAMIGNYENNTSYTKEYVLNRVKSLNNFDYDVSKGLKTEDSCAAMNTILPNRGFKHLYNFKFDTFAWYANKNHPVFMVINFYDDSADGGHIVVGGGYNRADESIQIIDPGEYEHKEYMPYSELTDIAVFETKNGHQIAVNIDSIVVYP